MRWSSLPSRSWRRSFSACALGLFTLRGNLGVRSAGRGRRRRRKQEIEHAFFRGLLGAVCDFVEFFLSDHVDGGFHKIADHRFHIASHVTNSVYFEASTLMKGQPARRAKRRAISVFPTPVGPIIRMFLGKTSSAISGGSFWRRTRLRQSDSDGALRGGLPDDILVELGDDFARRHIIESGRSSCPSTGSAPLPPGA